MTGEQPRQTGMICGIPLNSRHAGQILNHFGIAADRGNLMATIREFLENTRSDTPRGADKCDFDHFIILKSIFCS